MFGSKPQLKEGTYVFSVKKNGDFNDFIFAVVSGVDGRKVGVNGVIVNPIGLKNKISQGKTGERSEEILNHPTPDNVVLALVYRVESENYADVLDLDVDKCDILPPKVYAVLDGWIRESIPEFVNTVLSLAPGTERDEAKRILLDNRIEILKDEIKRKIDK